MKLIGKNILACAVGAGLLTFATGSTQAVTFGDDFVTTLNAQLIIKWSDSNGKVQKASITSKDLVEAIGEDFEGDVKSDQIVYDWEEGDYWLASKKGEYLEDLSEDGVIVANYNSLSDSFNSGNKDQYKYAETGTLDFEFYSDGDQDQDLEDDPNIDDNTLAFIDDEVSYTLTATGSAVKNNDEQQTSITEKDGLNGDGHDFDVNEDFDDLPVFGMITQNGSGKTDFDFYFLE